MSGFQLLTWVGAGITLVGVAGLMWTAFTANQLRKSGLEDADLRRALQKAVLRNMVALFTSVIGLMMVVVGISLG
jgi:hypothetical protein